MGARLARHLDDLLMRVVIFGATGRTGRHLIDQALELGHEVTAFARKPAMLESYGSRIRVVPGDITDSASVSRAVAGQEAVLSALGSPTIRKNTVLSDGTGFVLDAMRQHGVRRLLCMSALGVGETKGQLGPLYNYLWIPLMLRHIFAEKERMEARIRTSDTHWTIVRPGLLTNGPARRQYRVGLPGDKPPPVPRISRADVAHFMLREMVERRYLRQAVGLWYDGG